ncbi:HAD family hydrolase [Streptomyces klenkii]|uniref:HAD family hydrolase n=1 Tax=Streptomyces klenkii TaxID=1420899 RepID=UPI00343C416C
MPATSRSRRPLSESPHGAMAKGSMPRAALFNLGGTLFNASRVIADLFRTTVTSLGDEAPDPAAIRAVIGLPLAGSFSTLLDTPEHDWRVAYCVQRYQSSFAELLQRHAADLLFPGVADGLALLRERGMTLAVVTGQCAAHTEALLVAAGVRRHFAVVVSGDDIGSPKPLTEPARYALRQLGIPSGQTVLVGDTIRDILMAEACGMRSVGITHGLHSAPTLTAAGASWVADSFDSALRIITTHALDN